MDRFALLRQVLLGGLLLSPMSVSGQTIDRARVEEEATGQAAEADRLYRAGNFRAALPLYEAERASRAAIADIRYEAYALRAMGCCRGELGDEHGAIQAWTQARDLDLRREDQGFAGYDDLLIARAETRLGKLDAAIASLIRSLPRLAKVVDQDHEADARLLLGENLAQQDRLEEAGPHAQRSLALAVSLHDDERKAAAWELSGRVDMGLGRLQQAQERFQQALTVWTKDRRPREAARLLTDLGESLARLGRHEDAALRFGEAVTLHETLGDRGALAEDRIALATVRLAQGRLPDAVTEAERALVSAQEANSDTLEVYARVVQSEVLSRKEDWAAAAETLDTAVKLGRRRSRDDPGEHVRILLLAATIDRRAKLESRSRERMVEARRVAEKTKSSELIRQVDEADRPLP